MPLWCGPRRAKGRAWVAAAALTALLSAPALAADTPKPPTPEARAQADAHYAHARELYEQGAYREAIGELESALALDPNGKGLVFNLGVVHEKLGDIDDALRYFRRYEQMDLDPKERAKAEANIKRLEGAGARHEVEKPPVIVETPAPTSPPPSPPPPPPAAPPPHGRVDALTIGALVVGVGGLAVGTGFGLRALALRPPSGFVTGRDGSFDRFQNDASKAHKDAIISDVGFATGLVATAAAAYLYFARTRAPQARPAPEATAVSLQISGSILRGGGALMLGGRF